MRYKQQGRNGVRRLKIPALSGGLNTSTDAAFIEDNELSDACNVLWKHGALTRRPSLTAHKNGVFVHMTANKAYNSCNIVNYVHSHPFEVKGKLCTVTVTGIQHNPQTGVGMGEGHHIIHVLSLDGEIVKRYTMEDKFIRRTAVAPCDKDRYGCEFLLYGGNVVFRPNDQTGEMERIPDDELYAPLVLINGKGAASVNTNTDTSIPGRIVTGVMYEGFNTLTKRYRARFTTGGGTRRESFFLPTKLDSNRDVTVEVITSQGTFTATAQTGSVTIGGTTHSITVDPEDGRVDITPPFPESVTSDNLTVTCYAKTATEDSTNGATIAAWFGGTQNRLGGTRLFLSGFEKDKAKVMWSDVSNPLYFPENNYMYVGDLSQRVTALEKQEDMLVIFKERELYYTTYVQGSIDEDAVAGGLNVDVTVSQAYFPLTQLSPYIGCDCPHSIAVCRNRLVWMCADARVYTLVAGSQYSERNVREIGAKIRSHMLADSTETQRKKASAMDHDGHYVVAIGDRAYSLEYDTTGFVYLSSQYSEDRLSRSIAWFAHHFDTLSHDETLTLVSDGADRAIAIGTQKLGDDVDIARILYIFSDEENDDIVTPTVSQNGAGNIIVDYDITRKPIRAAFTTKAYDFGDATSFKRVGAVFLTAQGDGLCVSFVVDGKEDNAQKRVSCDGIGAHLIVPGVKRCRTLAVRVETLLPFKLHGLSWQFTPFGMVR